MRSQSVTQGLGLTRSLLMYYGNPLKLRRLQRFYAQLMQPGDLCFDIGAHVGNRLWAWLRLGAAVVAVEPQPMCHRFLQRWYGNRPGVTVVTDAVGAMPGEATLHISERTPTVTTLSANWIEAVRAADSFATVQWQSQLTVPVTTLDALIAAHGLPAFCKIDVEGFELAVLEGLSQPINTISFEYVPASKSLAIDCLARLQQLDSYTYNWSIGEQHRWQSTRWLTIDEMNAVVAQFEVNDPSGDIYARRIDHG